MQSFAMSTILVIAISVFMGALIYKRLFEPVMPTQLKKESKQPEYRSPVDAFLDNF